MQLLARDMPRSALVGLLMKHVWPEDDDPLLWVECPDTAELVPLGAEGGDGLVQRSFAGRLFAASGELRWRTMRCANADGTREAVDRVVFLGEACPRLSETLADHSSELENLTSERRTVALWGESVQGSVPPAWFETRIHCALHYPWDGIPARFLWLEQEVWRDDAGEAVFVRLCRLRADPARGPADEAATTDEEEVEGRS